MNQEELRRNTLDALARLSQSGELPVLPAAATAAIGIAQKPNPDMEKLCRVIESDAGLAAKTLRVANSLAVGRWSKVKTIRDAVVTTGVNTACEILVAACVREIYGGWGSYGGTLWNHALVVALGAEHLAEATSLAQSGEAFVPGLFHDVGRLVFLLIDPDAFRTIERLGPPNGDQRIGFERFWYGFDHALAGSILVEDWGLSLEQCDAISWHHEVAEAGAGHNLAALLCGADAIAYTLGFAARSDRPSTADMDGFSLSHGEILGYARQVLEAFERHKRALG